MNDKRNNQDDSGQYTIENGKLGIDGKNISRGKGKAMGDIDCWGFEAKHSLQERKHRLELELNQLNETYRQVKAHN